MKTTFVCDESMIITIPLGNFKNNGAGQLMPEKFNCVFRDSFKVFVVRGKPKPLGAAQAIAGVFLCTLGLVLPMQLMISTLSSVLFVVSGLLSYTAGKGPCMCVAKLSFSLNIISFFWSIAVFSVTVVQLQHVPIFDSHHETVFKGVTGLKMSLLVVENFVAAFLIYWMSKAICREDFNTLPIILLKQRN